MLKPNFKKYSLVLIKDNEIIYSSNKSGLKPLIGCVKKYGSKFKGCILYDRVIGLAAARLIVYSKIISKVISQVSSKTAKELLKKNGIELITKNIVNNILTKNKQSICPMEVKAMEIKNNKSFFLRISKHKTFIQIS